ncbi:MAG: MerR family DNA-binding transcriptional regulator [Planctomycetes bacterium]|nr:MerR family DNA-binding transcriptional regulator [Planctomycetota bacterium]
MKKLSEYLTVGDAASYIGVASCTLRRWDATGKLKARRHPVSKFRLYLREELDAILAGASEPEATKPRPRKRRTKQ